MDTLRLAFEQDLSRFIKFMKVKQRDELENERFPKSSNKQLKSHTTLFNLWNTYEQKLGVLYLEDKFLLMGDLLFSLKEYNLAVNQCYLRYLARYGRVDAPYDPVLSGWSFTDFSQYYFPRDITTQDTVKTIRALLGIAISHSYEILAEDARLKRDKTPSELVSCLKVIQLTLQYALEKEEYCWLVYNGTIHIYTICRHMMANGQSRRALEYLIWACVCMESSVPLMTTRYLTWRCQLYTAVCHCYYDLNLSTEAEAFAKRGLNMIQELQDIDEMSVSESGEDVKRVFKGAKLRLQIMVFKRNVFESRRRPKGILRPKNKPPLKDLVHNPWPRTTTERMLADTFSGRSAQFLAVVEALSDSKRRIIQTSLGAPESDDSILDVFAELFFAGCELASGGGGTRAPSPGKHPSSVSEDIEDKQLIDMAATGENAITISSLVRFVQLAYNYESWDTFESLVQPTISILNRKSGIEKFLIDSKSLEILSAMLPLNTSKVKKKVTLGMEEKDNSEIISTKQSAGKVSTFIDDILNLVEVIESCLNHENSKLLFGGLTDILMDACSFVWTKCKNHYSRVTSSSPEAYKHAMQDPHLDKWIKALSVVQRAMVELHFSDVDPCAFSEASLKLALLIEFFCSDDFLLRHLKREAGETVKQAQEKENLKSERSLKFKTIASNLNCLATPWSLLSFAKRRLQYAISSIDDSRSSAKNMDAPIADESLLKEFPESSLAATSVKLDASALQMEVIYTSYRIDCKLSIFEKESGKDTKKTVKKDNARKEGFIGMTVCAGKNVLSKAMYLICKAEIEDSRQQSHHTLKESFDLLQKASQSEAKLMKSNSSSSFSSRENIPAPPQLIFRSPNVMVFRPRPFVTQSGEEVKWYRLYVRSASGNNVKVRPSDSLLPGTGKDIPNGSNCLLKVSGLTPNEKYVVAVAAYNHSGQMIGDSIGQTSRPVLAASPLPIAIAYGYLAKVSYQCGAWQIAKDAFKTLWNHFTLPPGSTENKDGLVSARENTDLKLFRMNATSVNRCSTVLLRYFIQTIFISVDIAVKEGQLFCDSLCDFKPLYSGQHARLEECRKLLIAIHVAGLVNDNSTSLQAVIQCYGLLAPLLQMEIHTKPVLQVLCHCFAVLQELQSLIKHRKQSSVSENLQHMVSCITFYIAKVLEEKHQRFGAIRILEYGNRIIVGDAAAGIPDSAATTNTAFGSLPGPRKIMKRGTFKKSKVGVGKPGNKGMTDLTASENIAMELKTLETYVLKLKRHGDFSKDDDFYELNGTEEAQYVHAVLSCLPTATAYKEVSKFKRRAHFLEHFVVVLQRALNDGLHSLMIDWTKDAVTWLTRRNEILLNKQSPDQKGGTVVVAVEDEKNRKFSTTVAEYGKPKSLTAHDLLPIQESPRVTSKKDETTEDRISTKKEHSHKNSEKKNRSKRPVPLTEAEKKLKDATQKLQELLPEYYKMTHRKRRLRAVALEELPWRTQMNLLMAQCTFDLSNDKLKAVMKSYGLTDNHDEACIMEQDWFTLSTSGTLTVSWAGCPVQNESEIEPTIDIGGRSIANEGKDGRSTKLRIDHISGKGKVVIKSRASQNGRHSQKNHLDDGQWVSQHTDEPMKVYLHYINNTLVYLRRSMVLACRGKNWILLQNSAHELYNISNNLHRRVMGLMQSTSPSNKRDLPLDVQKLRELLWYPFFTAADSLLEMMNYIYWDAKEKNKKEKAASGDSMNATKLPFGGDIDDHNGGLSLHFDEILDDTSVTHFIWLKKIIWYAVEIMYFEEKWEKLVEIITRFSALTRDRFAESLLPIVIYAQRQLRNRLQRLKSLPGPDKIHPKVVFDKETGIPLQAFFDQPDVVSIEPGAHIDPEGHDLYDPKTEGITLVSVPLDVEGNLERLHKLLDAKRYSARALEHSRRLLLLYLAGKQNGGVPKAKLRQGSRVSFNASQIKPQSATPADLKEEIFEEREDIESYPLPDAQLAVVISSYDKTIETLQYRQESSLAAQAMHELGNLMMHSGNTRLAYKWWADTLDTILDSKDALKSWRSLLLPEKNSIRSSRRFIDTCGIWGCVLGGVLATKIARYIHTTNLGMRSDFCHLSAAMFQGLLCSSLPHPSAFIDYASYDIGLNQNVKELLPGVDLFSDIFRADCGNVVGALLWTVNELIRTGFYLQALPLLSICQYLTNDVCKDVRKSVEVKLLRVRALAGLNLFAEAIKQMEHVFRSNNLPSLSLKRMRVTTQIQQKFGNFSNAKKLTDQANVKVIRELCTASLANAQIDAYGIGMARMVEVTQSHLLNCIAGTINSVPEETAAPSGPPVIKEEVSPELKRSSSKSKKTSPRKKNTKTKTGISPSSSTSELAPEEVQMTMPRTKGLLLSSSEGILKRIVGSLNGQNEESVGMTAENLELLCLSEVELSRVADMRLFPITAAKHIFKAMKAIENASVLTETDLSSDIMQIMVADKKLLSSSEHNLMSANPKVNIDARLWLTCRLKISQYLSDCIKIPVDDSPLETEAVIGTAEYHIDQGLNEAEAFGDDELALKFSMLEIYKSLHTGDEAADIAEKLECLVNKLSSLPEISLEAEVLLLDANILINDVIATTGQTSNADSTAAYSGILDNILTQMMHMGIDIIPSQMTVAKPLKNIYNNLLESLAAVKLRIGKCKATDAGQLADAESRAKHWSDVNRCLDDALELQQLAAKESPSINVEIVFIKGLVMRQLFELDNVPLKDAVEALIEVVKLSSQHTQDLSMIRHVYLELALAYLSFYEKSEAVYLKSEKQRLLEETDKDKERKAGSAKSNLQSSSSLGKQAQKQQKALQAAREKEARAREKQRQAIRKAAWVAIRAAGAISKAQQKLETLSSDVVVVSAEMKALSAPDFSLFEIFKTDSIERDSNTGALVNNSGMIKAETRSGHSESIQFSWLHLVNYLKNLRRLTGYVGMGLGEGSKLCVRTAYMTSRTALKLEVMHNFLRESLMVYEKECCPILPVDYFLGQSLTLFPSKDVPAINVTQDEEDEDGKRADKSPTRNSDALGRSVTPKDDGPPIVSARRGSFDPSKSQISKIAAKSDRIHVRDPLQASELEVAMQWYHSELFKEDATTLLYAMNSKPITVTDKAASFAAIVVMSQLDVQWPSGLRQSLMELFRTAESDLNQQPGTLTKTAVAIQAASTISSTSPTRKKKPVGIKSIAQDDKEEEIKTQLKNVLEILNHVFKKDHQVQEIPFETTLDNIACLEKLFNTSFGHLSKTTDAFFTWLSRLLN